jgi:hypothetical protein
MTDTLEPQRRTRPGTIAAIAVAVLVLAVIGATAGYFAAGNPRNSAADTGTTPPATSTPTPLESTPTNTPTTADPTTNTPSAGVPGFALPNLVGQDFEDARRKLRELGLGWRLVFGQSGDDKTVGSTTPRAGSPVRRGTTVTLNVRGQAPVATIPGVVGIACTQAAALIVDHGLYPQYPTGRTGTVYKQEPEAGGTTTVRWNDQVKIYCGTASPNPTSTY